MGAQGTTVDRLTPCSRTLHTRLSMASCSRCLSYLTWGPKLWAMNRALPLRVARRAGVAQLSTLASTALRQGALAFACWSGTAWSCRSWALPCRSVWAGG
jgi:hypothetical protein